MRVLDATGEGSGGAIAEAAEVLRSGGLVAFPTETVYGLGAAALDADAVARIFAAKGRPSWNPLIVHVASLDHARALASDWTATADTLARRFWPGPLTIVVERVAGVPDAVTAGLSTIALRIPAHPVAQSLLRAAAIPVAAPSANRSTRVSPTRAEHVVAMLGEAVDIVLDGGACRVGIESTVVDARSSTATILRPGGISRRAIEAIVSVADVADAATDGQARHSPGQMQRHYAPDAEVRFFRGTPPAGAEGEARTAVIAYGAASGGADTFDLPADPDGYATRIYDLLHDIDARGYTVVWIEEPPDEPAWEAVRDRLRRASHRVDQERTGG